MNYITGAFMTSNCRHPSALGVGLESYAIMGPLSSVKGEHKDGLSPIPLMTLDNLLFSLAGFNYLYFEFLNFLELEKNFKDMLTRFEERNTNNESTRNHPLNYATSYLEAMDTQIQLLRDKITVTRATQTQFTMATIVTLITLISSIVMFIGGIGTIAYTVLQVLLSAGNLGGSIFRGFFESLATPDNADKAATASITAKALQASLSYISDICIPLGSNETILNTDGNLHGMVPVKRIQIPFRPRYISIRNQIRHQFKRPNDVHL